MCEPATLSLIATGLGTAVSAVGAIGSGMASRDAAQYQAAVDRNNVVIANQARRDALERGAEAELAQRRKTSDAIGRQRAAFGASGIEIGGSALDVLGDTAQFGELDALTVRNNAEREAAGYAARAQSAQQNAMLNDNKASNALASGFMNAGSTALAGAGTVADKWYRLK